MDKRIPFATGTAKSLIHGDLSPDDVIKLITDSCKAIPVVTTGDKSSKKHYVMFTPYAWESFSASVSYGKWVPENELESQYYLEGYYFRDKNGVTSTVVTNIITPVSAVQKRAFVQLFSEENNAYAYIEQRENLIKEYCSSGKDNKDNSVINPCYDKYGPPIRTGVGHTHPNIGTFLSGVDRTSVFATRGEPWITMVADPRLEELLVAVGAELETASVILFDKPRRSVQKQNAEAEYNSNDCYKSISPVDFLNLAVREINKGSIFKIKLNGSFPGKVTFKGEFNAPKQKKVKPRKRVI